MLPGKENRISQKGNPTRDFTLGGESIKATSNVTHRNATRGKILLLYGWRFLYSDKRLTAHNVPGLHPHHKSLAALSATTNLLSVIADSNLSHEGMSSGFT